ncbi:reverse transcriptase domain-containing protein [Tanacetum coccineum]
MELLAYLSGNEKWLMLIMRRHINLSLQELNPGNFTLPCTIGNLNFYGMADLGASVNVMPMNIFEYLRLANLRNTNMLVELADMTKKAPLGIDNDRVSYDMEKKDHNFTTPIEKIFMMKSDLDNRPQSPACSNHLSRNLRDRSPNDGLHDQGNVHRDSTYWWHDHGFKEEERNEIGIEIEKYDPPYVQVPAARRQLSRPTRPVILW